MPDPATADQSATATRPRQSIDGAAQPSAGPARLRGQQTRGKLGAAINQMRGLARRVLRRI